MGWVILQRFFIGICAVALMMGSAVSGHAAEGSTPGAPPIKLKAGSFTPALGEAPDIPPGLVISGYEEGERGYYIVQFSGPVKPAWREQLAATGAEVLVYLPEFAFKVRMTPAQARTAEQLSNVTWVGLFQPAYKLSPNLERDGTRFYRVRIASGADAGSAVAKVAATGARIVQGDANIMVVAANAGQLDAIAGVLDVAWIESFAFPEKLSEYAGGILWGTNPGPAPDTIYNGSTQTIGIADTGLGDGTKQGGSPHIDAGRITAIRNWRGANHICYRIRNDGAQDVNTGHGTHVAVSALGDGPVVSGIAPAANLVLQSIENYLEFRWSTICLGANNPNDWPDGYYLNGIPNDVGELFQQAYNDGARIHSNSWGVPSHVGQYDIFSATADTFIWNNPDMTVVFAAGNSGVDNNNNGVVDSGSVIAPSTAKNVISVGASENDRAGDYPCDISLPYASHDIYQNGTCGGAGTNMGGTNTLGTYGGRYGFAEEPLKSDPTAGNPEQLAAWSSRGPTRDGRIKPDLVTPGTWVLSGYSNLFREVYDDELNPMNGAFQWDGWGMPESAELKYMGGTSMATPHASGAAAIVRDYYQKAHGHSASAALVKATLINSAVDMLDENNDGSDDNAYPIPNDHEGWGRIDLGNATSGGNRQFRNNIAGINTADSAAYAFTVTGDPFKVTLVWSDYPAAENAATALVNDLDLVVTDGTTTYRGNTFSLGWSVADGEPDPDRVNNLENVYIESPLPGTWTVTVVGFNVPQGPQPFALVVDGVTSGPSPDIHDVAVTAIDAPPNPPVGSAATVSVTVANEGTVEETFAVAVTDNLAASIGPQVEVTLATGASDTLSFSWTPTVTGTHKLTATATAANGDVQPSDNTMTTTVSVLETFHMGDLDTGATTVEGNTWTAEVDVTVHDSNHFPIASVRPNGAVNGSSERWACQNFSNASGQCTISIPGLRKKRVTFTIMGTTALGALSYDSSANHDPDGDSDGTSIRIIKP